MASSGSDPCLKVVKKGKRARGGGVRREEGHKLMTDRTVDCKKANAAYRKWARHAIAFPMEDLVHSLGHPVQIELEMRRRFAFGHWMD